ncbi:MAG: hypothetical protein ABI682_16980, partial [Acidobacteriota bacterium]
LEDSGQGVVLLSLFPLEPWFRNRRRCSAAFFYFLPMFLAIAFILARVQGRRSACRVQPSDQRARILR